MAGESAQAGSSMTFPSMSGLAVAFMADVACWPINSVEHKISVQINLIMYKLALNIKNGFNSLCHRNALIGHTALVMGGESNIHAAPANHEVRMVIMCFRYFC